MWIRHPTTSELSQTECATNQQPGAYSSVDSGELLLGSFLDQGSLGSEGHSSSWQPPSSMASCHLGKCSFGVYIGPSHFFCGTHCDLWPCLTCCSHHQEHPSRIPLHLVCPILVHTLQSQTQSLYRPPDMSTCTETHSVVCSRCSSLY